ncbi:helix-turn-helix domain-containing protein [Aliarcobacter thereius]|uniref:Transposon Tn10 TetD protein n=1 Tax=Aliarcobacter thereius LMG 24486 TaxID=1032240 RepID=A0A1C7WQQ5_9BACT|nr:AraC family transcriptional regulator [Aliarcobacter thereius]OCL92182.1 Transposon Tn10 TetD protein [Aliarcobacter thereius]OCL94722.1 Transposon Tn10 TetD protein [Aliarcobacter thereius LMG 24486]QBF15402.1 transcriptional regulator, AraC family [Aliarcobacter thereius LMG 24486]TLS93219.1 helix-turn-helix transcriptional regulator [Aliarcobacter thereius]TLT07981.1 helix-turn-helix transcriptional regulator [Aliarcobacter thereius]
MSIIPEINFHNFLDLEKEIINPFGRLIHIRNINKNLGEGAYFWYDMGNGIGILIKKFKLYKDITLIEQSGGISGATFIFNLAEDLNYSFLENDFTLKKNNFFVELISDTFNAKNNLKKNKNYHSIMIAIKEELFLELAYPIKDIKNNMDSAYKNMRYHIYNGLIDLEQFELLNNLIDNYINQDSLKNLYLESKNMNLLHYTIKKIASNENKDFTICQNRLNSLNRAKEIIMKDYNQNLSIKDIAYKSAINECYLKKDFKEYFGITIAEMIQKRRLEVAKKILKNGLSVKEVSLRVGYKHSGNFSKLFYNSFKISPNDYKKQIELL